MSAFRIAFEFISRSFQRTVGHLAMVSMGHINLKVIHLFLPHCGLGYFNEILDECFSSQLQWLMAEIPHVKLPSKECHQTLLRISQHWFRWWLGAVRQQTITWAIVDTIFCHHMASLGPNELKRSRTRASCKQAMLLFPTDSVLTLI